MHIIIQDNIKNLCPELCLGIIECKIENTSYNQSLWDKIDYEIEDYSSKTEIPSIKQNPIISATREVYKKCGKDPNRYRPSSEALCRRIVNGKGLYQITTGVDLINLVSFKTGYSIGAFDADLIEGDLSYGIGQKGEDYNAIGRGILNIEGLPILRDEKGGIGTPTSDEERTKLSIDTTSLLVNINGYLGEDHLAKVADECIILLQEHLNAESVSLRYIK